MEPLPNKLERIQEHIIQPYREEEFYPLALYRGSTPISWLKTRYTFLCTAMELEIPSADLLVASA